MMMMMMLFFFLVVINMDMSEFVKEVVLELLIYY